MIALLHRARPLGGPRGCCNGAHFQFGNSARPPAPRGAPTGATLAQRHAPTASRRESDGSGCCVARCLSWLRRTAQARSSEVGTVHGAGWASLLPGARSTEASGCTSTSPASAGLLPPAAGGVCSLRARPRSAPKDPPLNTARRAALPPCGHSSCFSTSPSPRELWPRRPPPRLNVGREHAQGDPTPANTFDGFVKSALANCLRVHPEADRPALHRDPSLPARVRKAYSTVFSMLPARCICPEQWLPLRGAPTPQGGTEDGDAYAHNFPTASCSSAT